MYFNRIVSVDTINLSEEAISEIKKYSEQPAKFYNTDPKDDKESISRIGGADCVLVSWRTKLGKEIFEKCRNIKYISLCGTSFANIDVKEAKARKILVSNVVDYGDEAAAEFVFAQLLCLARGWGNYQWKKAPCELFKKTLGMVGLGAVGKQVARLGLGFGMNVIYFSRKRNADFERKGLKFMELHDLLKSSDIISLHVPKNTLIMSKKEFDMIPNGAILVDTCMGKVFNEHDFIDWIKKGDNFAIFDFSGNDEFHKQFKDIKNVVFSDAIAGKTIESWERLSIKAVENLKLFLDGKPINVV